MNFLFQKLNIRQNILVRYCLLRNISNVIINVAISVIIRVLYVCLIRN